MTLPNKVKVGGVKYSVEETDVVIIDGDTNYAGSCSYVQNEIKILNSMTEDRKEQTLIHELTHAILYEAGYDDHDEELVDRFSKVLYQVLKDNPNLVEPFYDTDNVCENVQSQMMKKVMSMQISNHND